MNRNLIKWGLLALIFSACEPKPDSAILLDEFVVVTDHDLSVQFSDYTTYAIPTDTIWLYSNAVNDTLLVQNRNSSYPQPVIKAVIANMAGRGFTKVKRNENPDLGINVSVVHNYEVYQQINYGGYGGGYGYGSGYYGYGSSYYNPSYVTTTSTNNGALIIEIVDLKNKTPDNKVNVIWTANMGDIINAIELEKQSVKGIDQAFTQSPYLDK